LISLQREHVLKDLSKITLLTRRQAAELLAMSESQLDRATQQGTLSAINHDRRPRYSLEDIKVFIASRRAEKRRQRP
jgi:hypothetical protein